MYVFIQVVACFNLLIPTFGALFSASQRLFLHIWLLLGCIQALQIPHLSSGFLKQPGHSPQRFLLLRLVIEESWDVIGAGNCFSVVFISGESCFALRITVEGDVVGEGVSSTTGLRSTDGGLIMNGRPGMPEPFKNLYG